MRSTWFVLLIVAGLLPAPGLRAEDEPEVEKKLDAAGVLELVDGALFFPDSQEGLQSYTCRASVTKGSKSGPGRTMIPDASKAELLAEIEVDVAKGTRTWTLGKKALPVGAWTPFCGPWTLTEVIRVETELFLTPLSPRFPEEAYTREVEETADGWRLVLTPKSGNVNGAEGDILEPAVTRIELSVGRDGVPTRGTFGLDQRLMNDDGKLTFEFVNAGEKKRIDVIRSTIVNANLTIHPVLRFGFDEQKGFTLPEQIVFEVPPGDLSPSLGAGPMAVPAMPSALLFTNYKVKGKKPR